MDSRAVKGGIASINQGETKTDDTVSYDEEEVEKICGKKKEHHKDNRWRDIHKPQHCLMQHT